MSGDATGDFEKGTNGETHFDLALELRSRTLLMFLYCTKCQHRQIIGEDLDQDHDPAEWVKHQEADSCNYCHHHPMELQVFAVKYIKP